MKQAIYFFLFGAISMIATSCQINVAPTSSEKSSDRIHDTSSALTSSTPIESSSGPTESITSAKEESTTAITSEEIPSFTSEDETPSFASEESYSFSSQEDMSSCASKVESESISQNQDPEEFHFYCVNDFHGAIKAQEGNYGHFEYGISSYFGELASRKHDDPEHTILLSAGDMWQGSLESNDSKGLFVTEAMNAAGFDAMAIGNHEFDFGIENLKNNAESAQFPFLAGNIMYYSSPSTHDDSFGTSTVIERGGIKIGIVGMIGEGQTTSITSHHVKDHVFVNPLPLALKEATRLKEEEGTDINILLLHDESSAITNQFEYVKDSGKTLSDYFDVAFCGHTHSYNNEIFDGVPLLQSYCNGQAYSHATITFDHSSITSRKGEVEYVPVSARKDEDVETVVSKYLTDELLNRANRVAGTIYGSFNQRGVATLSCKAIYDRYSSEYPNLACTMVNSQRSWLSGEVTYSDIYKATPFSNEIVIASVKGSDIIREAKWNPTYTGDLSRFATLNSDQYYDCAVIDYIFYHMNNEKTYDYFPHNNPGGGNQVIDVKKTYPYDLVFDYLKTKETIRASDYSGTQNGFDCYQ